MKNLFLLTTVLTFAFPVFVPGQQEFPNSKFYDEEVGSPKATIDDVHWIAGHWRGKAFGGVIEEVWTPPLGNSMMCSFKLVVEGKVDFYELVTISEEDSSLVLRLKHFHGNLDGWEEKDESLEFQLVEITPEKVFFDGFTFEKYGEDELNVYVVFDNNGQKSEMMFHYTRVKP